MNALSRQIPRGIYAASLTPCHPDLSCDLPAMAEHCKELISRGCQGIIIFGTTGEGASFSVRERKKVLNSLIKTGLESKKLIPAISCCAIPDVVDLAQDALTNQCAAVLILPPFFYKNVDDAATIAFYREVVLRVNNPDLRIILYHIPQFSGVSITINVINQLLMEFPDQVIGIKESEGNMNLIKEILHKFPDFGLFVGNEHLISEAVRLGAAGAIVGMANAFPELLCSLYASGEGIKQSDDNKKMALIRNIIRQYPFIPALKSMIEKRKGAAWHTLRPPLLPLDSSQREALETQLSTMTPEFTQLLG